MLFKTPHTLPFKPSLVRFAILLLSASPLAFANAANNDNVNVPQIETLNSAPSQAQPNFQQLMQAFIQRQPQQNVLSGLQTLQSAQQDQARSWIAGDVNVIVHHENDALTDNNDSQNWQVGAEFPIWLPSQKQGNNALAESYEQTVVVEQAYLNWLASGKLRELMWNYQIALAELKNAQESIKTSQQLLETIQKQVTFGENAPMDGVLAEQTYLSHKADLIQQQSNVMVAKQAYQKWTGFSELPITIKEPKSKLSLDEHPEMVQMQSELARSNVLLKQLETQKSGQPSLYLGAQQDKLQNQTDTSLVMQVSIPLGMNPQFDVKKAEQQLEIKRQQARFEQVKQTLSLQQQQAAAQLEQLKQTINLTDQQYDLAQQALDMSLKAYKLGAISVQNLLLIQQQTIDTKRRAILARLEFGQATANYNQISGELLGATNR